MNIRKWAELDKNLLLLGETGTGKSTTAFAIHNESSRKNERFHKVNLATLSDNLLESELFGHSKGAFTGAHKDKIGHCLTVGTGTLFLDEIGELSANGQKKLLSLLEEGTFTPVGSTTEIKFRGKVIAATNKDLKEEVENGRFREDLYYRLLTFSFTLKPLRSCRQKVQEIISAKTYEYQGSGNNKKLSKELYDLLKSHSWPGNIRELNSCLDYLYLMSDNILIEKSDLPHWLVIKEVVELSCKKYHMALETFEKQYLIEKLMENEGRINQTSRLIEISKSTLIAKVRKYGINTDFIKYENYKNTALHLVA